MASTSECRPSKIFEGYKALGFVTNHVPFIIRYVQKLDDLRIVTCVGRSFHSYNSRLRLLETSHPHDSDINCLASDSIYVFSAAGNNVFTWKHGHKWLVHTYRGHESKVIKLLPFGPHLISVDESSRLCVWEIKNEELFLDLPFSKDSFEISALMHPSTYVNKILLGSRQGSLQLWNLRTQKLIYSFGSWNSAVTVIEQAPAIDIVAIGLEDGRIFVHNLKADETLMAFRQEWGAVMALSFRTDGPPVMVSTGPLGHIALWDLEKKKLSTQMRSVHAGPVHGCQFIQQEPLLVTSSSDNSLKVWIFDQSDDSGRMLHEREGHFAAPLKVKFHGRRGHHVLSAGLDSTLRCFSTLSERLNRNFGFASFNRKKAKKMGAKRDDNKMPPIVEFTTELTREKEWDNIVACHRRLGPVSTWSYDKAKMGEHKMMHKRFKGIHDVTAVCLCLSACGNFVTIGYNSGHIDRFNIQSAIHRATYGAVTAHDGSVEGIASDNLNQLVVSGGVDGLLKFWRFKTGELLTSLQMDESISKLVLHRESSLLAVAFDNFTVKVIDLETRRAIRSFPSHSNKITDMAFSLDARWLVVSSMDRSIRTWDLPRGQLIDMFLVSTPCISLSMSPTGEYLATAHTQDVGVYLWSNITVYSPVNLRPLPSDYKASLLELPCVRADVRIADSDEVVVDNDEEENDTLFANKEDVMEDEDQTYKSPEQISSDLVTLSLLPSSRWKNLIHLDLIKKRNKPKEPPAAPKAAPFFIPTIAGLNPTFGVGINDSVSETNSKISAILRNLSPFSELLLDCANTSNYAPILSKLRELGPSAIDAEIRSLDVLLPSPTDEDEMETEASNEKPILLSYFLKAMEQGLKSKKDFELLQSYLGLFLKIHSDIIVNDADLVDECIVLSTLQNEAWDELQMKFHKTLCIVNYLRSAII